MPGNENAVSRDSDEALLKQILRELPFGGQNAFERLLFKYEKLIYHVAYRYFNNREDALDMAQEAVIKIYLGLPGVKLREGGTLKSWICAVTANTCLDRLRKRQPETVETPPEEQYANFVSARAAAPSAEETAEARERASEIMQAVAGLPEEWRRLIILRDMAGLSYQELAEATGAGVNTVKSRLSRARAALRAAVP